MIGNRLAESLRRSNIVMTTFGERLRMARKHARITQKVLSASSGVSQSVISEAENGGAEGSRFAVQLASACKVRPEWLATGRGHMLPHEAIGETDGTYNVSTRFVPLLNDVQAGDPKAIVDDYAPGAGSREIQLDPVTAIECGPHTFALEVSGNSMLPEFHEGDVVVIDPSAPWGPGDIVIAKLDREDRATLKKYRARGTDESGNDVFELVPLNDDYATIRVDREMPGRVIGPVVEHRRRLRRARR